MSKSYYVYIMGNQRPTLYVGVTNDLIRRVYDHKHGLVEGFTRKYGLKNLLYFEIFSEIEEAILREKRVKKWNRSWKIDLIRQTNPEFKDIYDQVVG